MAADGLFFEKFAQLHSRYRTPVPAIVFLGVWSAILVYTGKYGALLDYVVFADWIFFGLTALTLVVFRRRDGMAGVRFRVPVFPLAMTLFVAVAGYVVVGSILSNPGNAVRGVGLLALGLPVYLYWRSVGVRGGACAEARPGVPPVSTHALESGACQRCIPKPRLKLLLRHPLEELFPSFSQFAAVPKLRKRCFRRKAQIPGTDIVADIAPERPAVDLAGQFGGNLLLVLDREVGDALGGVEDVGLDKGVGGAGVEALGATAAVVGGEGRIDGQRQVGEDAADDEPGADAGAEEHRVLADPAEAGALGEFPLGDRASVHVWARSLGAVCEHQVS